MITSYLFSLFLAALAAAQPTPATGQVVAFAELKYTGESQTIPADSRCEKFPAGSIKSIQVPQGYKCVFLEDCNLFVKSFRQNTPDLGLLDKDNSVSCYKLGSR
ncbi:hypothetical protein HJFPF1_10582 [Paramyrothecium foliicola]|nr:hypothetical protein HJFPF1_10582 [Paramyrothecium foliicola]